jgi:glycosyltransferase involved in cell wall biosynthesis
MGFGNRKVLFITSSLNLGGAERQLLLLCEKLKLHFEIQLISLESDGPLKEKYLGAFPEMQFLVANKSGVFSKLYELRKIIKKSDPDLVITWLYKADLLGGLAAKLAGNYSVIWSARNSVIPNFSLFKKITLSFISRIVPTLVVANGLPAYRFHKSLRYHREKFRIIPNFLAPWALETRSNSRLLVESAPIDRLRVGIAARLISGKGILETIQTLETNQDNLPSIDLSIVGQKTHESEEWEISEEYGRCFVDQIISDVELAKWFQGIDLYLMPSTAWESQPNSLLEAMSIGCPILVSNKIEYDFYIPPHLLFDPCDSSSLVKSLQGLLRQDLASRQLDSKRSATSVLAISSEHQILATWIDLINETAKGE